VPPSGWEAYDALILGSALVGATLITSAHPPGWIQVRIAQHPRWRTVVAAACTVGLSVLIDPKLALVFGCLALVDIAWGLWRIGPGLRRVLRGAPS